MIDQRPEEAADRKIAGHWEGDLITGEANRSAIGTLSSGQAGTQSCCTFPAGTPPTPSATPSSTR
jgi:IS30 family transposase